MSSLTQPLSRPADPHHDLRRRRGGRHGADAGDAASGHRHAAEAHEGGRARAREDPAARTRAHGAEQQGVAAAIAENVHEAGGRQLQSVEMGRPGGGARQAGAGRLSRPGALRHLSVLPHDDADRHAARLAVLYFRRAQSRLSADDEDRDLHRLRLFRHAQSRICSSRTRFSAASFRSSARSRTRSICC